MQLKLELGGIIVKIIRGNIIMVDFGKQKGSVQSGMRPAVVIQNNVGNAHSTTTIVAPITGKQKKDLPTHLSLLSKNYKCLRCDSTLLGEQILTISKTQIIEVLGKLNLEDEIELNSKLAVSINLCNKVS